MINIDELRETFDYRPDSGQLIRRSSGAVVGNPSGISKHMYVWFRKKYILVHRIAWALAHGEWPQGQIDHVNCDRLDNRLANLRVVSHKVNRNNIRRPNKLNKVGLLGVIKKYNRFAANIATDGRRIHLGQYDTPEEAHSAYMLAKSILHTGANNDYMELLK